MKQTKKKKKANRKQTAQTHAPWLFLCALVLFAGFLTYAWGVWYIPTLPRTEIPPYLLDPGSQTDGSSAADSPGTQPSPSETFLSAGSETETPQTEPPKVPAKDPVPQQTTADTERETAAEETIRTPETTAVRDTVPPAAVKRKPGVYNILCAGRDAAAYNTDVLVLISYDTKQQTACAAQIPRDTFADGHKINALCAKYRGAAQRNSSADPTADGMEQLCDTLESALTVRIDHWVLIDLTAFRTVVDAVGGVDIDVPCDMNYDDDAQNLHIHLTAGPQTLDGEKAEQFVRFRKDYLRGDLGRTDMQKLFLSALFDRVQSGIPLSSLPSLAKTAVSAVDTDLSVTDLLFFLKEVRGLEAEHVTLCTLPGTDAREYGNSGAWYYILSRESVYEVSAEYLNVYETKPTASQFDAQGRLTDRNNPALDALYRRYVPAKLYTAAGVSGGDVHVTLTD